MQELAGWLAVLLLTGYQLPQLWRLRQRRSSQDFSVPAYVMVVAGLACYVVSTWGGPAAIPSLVSLTNACVMLGAILYWRRRTPEGHLPKCMCAESYSKCKRGRCRFCVCD